jgi:hypothetical protein
MNLTPFNQNAFYRNVMPTLPQAYSHGYQPSLTNAYQYANPYSSSSTSASFESGLSTQLVDLMMKVFSKLLGLDSDSSSSNGRDYRVAEHLGYGTEDATVAKIGATGLATVAAIHQQEVPDEGSLLKYKDDDRFRIRGELGVIALKQRGFNSIDDVIDTFGKGTPELTEFLVDLTAQVDRTLPIALSIHNRQ